METRITKLIEGSAGGTASKNAKTYKISIPTKWVNDLSLNERDVELSFDGKTIFVKIKETLNEFVNNKKELGHKLILIKVFDNDTLCSSVCADFTDKTVKHENYVTDCIKTPFGNNKTPSFTDFENYLKERCIPESRSGIREYLDVLNIDFFEPLQIIKKTNGVMAEDNIHLETEEL